MEDYIDYAEYGSMSLAEYTDFAEAEAQAKTEARAENAYLVWAETPTAEDEAFARWEIGKGCLLDPQSGY